MKDTPAAQVPDQQAKPAISPPKRRRGRPKGSENERTRVAREKARRRGNGLMPLEYMLAVMRNRSPKISEARRDWAAEKAAPYCHGRIVSVEAGGKGAEGLTLVGLVLGTVQAASNGVSDLLKENRGKR